MKFPATILFAAAFVVGTVHGQEIMLKGIITENDSVTPMPFVYIANKSNGNGTMSDNDGRFGMVSHSADTLILSYVGFLRIEVPVKKLIKMRDGTVKVTMIPRPIILEPVNITSFRIKPYEREYMSDIIDRSRIRSVEYISSPISALYMQFSREGRQIRKLAKIFEDLLIEEEVQRKLSPDILAKLTKDENIDYEAFRKYCYYVNNYYIVSHDGAELYTRVMECYRRWKNDINREQPRKPN